MAQLLDASEVLLRTSQADIGDVTDLITSVIESATEYLTAKIGTNMDQATYSDMFSLEHHHFGAIGKSIPLALAHGFLTTNTATIYIDYTAFGAEQSTALQVDAGSYKILPEKGIVQLYPDAGNPNSIHRQLTSTGIRAGSFLRIVYTAGFSTTNKLYTATEVPAWLKEAAMQYVIFMMNNSPDLRVEGDKTKTAPVLYDAIATAHTRMYPTAIKPMYSELI